MDRIVLYFNLDEGTSNKKETRRALRNMCQDIFQLSDVQFIKNFRLSKAAFNYGLNEMKSKLSPVVKSSSLSLKFKLATCLRFLAEGGYQNGVGQDHFVGMAQSTVSVVLSEVFDILEQTLCGKRISLKMSEDEKIEARLYFLTKCRIPGVVIRVDDTHIKIVKPAGDNTHLFYNLKGFFSLNTMIICDQKHRIQYVDLATYPGGNHDSFVWRNSDASAYFKTIYNNWDRNQKLFADAGYPLLPWVITSFKNTGVNTSKSRFNKSQIAGRHIVERTIGLWKNWCRCLLGVARHLHYSPDKAVKIINMAAALYNIRIHFNVPNYDEPTGELFQDGDATTKPEDEIQSQEDRRYETEANEFRNQILLNF